VNMADHIPTAREIIDDVENRIAILVRLIHPDSNLADDEWNQIIYYNELHKNQRKQFITAYLALRDGKNYVDLLMGLKPHAKWLLAVYTGQELTASWCYGGSRFHKKVLGMLHANYNPASIIRYVPGLDKAVLELQKNTPVINPKVIENIAIDETFELLGRAMS